MGGRGAKGSGGGEGIAGKTAKIAIPTYPLSMQGAGDRMTHIILLMKQPGSGYSKSTIRAFMQTIQAKATPEAKMKAMDYYHNTSTDTLS